MLQTEAFAIHCLEFLFLLFLLQLLFGDSESSIKRRRLGSGEGIYIIIKCVLYMNNLCTDLYIVISNFLNVVDTLHMELALGTEFRCLIPRDMLQKRYHREAKRREVLIRKRARVVKYVLESYYKDNILYTRVKSWYGKHSIVSVITHKQFSLTIEANLWTLRAFTDKSYRRWKHPLLLKLHLN